VPTTGIHRQVFLDHRKSIIIVSMKDDLLDPAHYSQETIRKFRIVRNLVGAVVLTYVALYVLRILRHIPF
jgi:hypothetical protein